MFSELRQNIFLRAIAYPGDKQPKIFTKIEFTKILYDTENPTEKFALHTGLP